MNPNCLICGKTLETLEDDYWCPRCSIKYKKDGVAVPPIEQESGLSTHVPIDNEILATPVEKDRRFLQTFNAVRSCLDGEFGPNKSQLSYYNFSRGDVKYILANSGPTDKLPIIRQLIYCRQTVVARSISHAPGLGGYLGSQIRSKIDGDEGHKTRDSKQEYYHYPHSPMTNFAVAVVKGVRVKGDFVISRGSGMFIPNPSIEHSRIFLESLNNLDLVPGTIAPVHTIADAARLLFADEQDFFQDSRINGWHARRYGDRSGQRMLLSQGWGQPIIGHTEYYDTHFLPTLLDTDAYDFTRWTNYPLQNKPSVWHMAAGLEYGKDKFYFVGITPYRDSTIILANIPTVCMFGQRGELLTVDLRIGWIKWILNGVISLLDSQENVVVPSQVDKEKKHPYWSTVNEFREKRKCNLPVFPFEESLKQIENPETKPTETTAPQTSTAETAENTNQSLSQG